jgi:1-acyl-sn-glycerol-3-phosphate acyltransferase
MAEATSQFTRNEKSLSVGVLRAAAVCFSRVYHHVDVRNHCRLPRTGAAILVCNHLSGLDPVLIQACCPRLIRWMMAREYYQQPVLKTIFDTIGIIPVDRSGRDMAATRAALRALKNGYVLGVFPEGKIETNGELLPFQSGIGLLAEKSQAPIYPAYMEGTQRGQDMLPAYFHRQTASLSFGEPLIFQRSSGDRQALHRFTDQVRNSVELLRQAELERLKKQRFLAPSIQQS